MLSLVRISPRTDGKVTKKRAQNKRNLNFFFIPSRSNFGKKLSKLRKVECRTKKKRFFLFMSRRSNFGESQVYEKLREIKIFPRVNSWRPPPFGAETGFGNLSPKKFFCEKTYTPTLLCVSLLRVSALWACRFGCRQTVRV